MTITDLFYIVVFSSVFGGLAWLLLIFAQKIFRLSLPFGICNGMLALYLIPIFFPQLKLVAPNVMWIDPFLIASKIWICGAGLFLLVLVFKTVVTWLTIKKFRNCTEERITAILYKQAQKLKLPRLPQVLLGDLKEPACVVSIGRPKIILTEAIIGQLKDSELEIVLTHELLHIKNVHTITQRIFDLICCIHWFNPIAWLAKQEYCLLCEVNCDETIGRAIPELKPLEYAKTMLKMMELSASQKSMNLKAIGALDFIIAKQRFQAILCPTARWKKTLSFVITIAILMGVITGSLVISRSYFYSYPAPQTGIEWSEQGE